MFSRIILLIPARMNSKRLPYKALSDINGYPMIIHVAKRVEQSKIGPVVIATDHKDIKNVSEKYGIQAVFTKKNHKSGSDRIHEVLTKIDINQNYDTVINVQGDLPTIRSRNIISAIKLFSKIDNKIDIGTICTEIISEKEKNNDNIVKVIGTYISKKILKAIYFTRSRAPYGKGPLYRHIGLYVYRREALERFVKFNQSILEKREKLEQLRAIENGMNIYVSIIKNGPLGIDTEKDLIYARNIL